MLSRHTLGKDERKEMMEERDPITNYGEFHQMVIDLLSSLTSCRSKYDRGSLADCPNLALPKDVRLEVPIEADNIADISDWVPSKHQKLAELSDDDSVGVVEEVQEVEEQGKVEQNSPNFLCHCLLKYFLIKNGL